MTSPVISLELESNEDNCVRLKKSIFLAPLVYLSICQMLQMSWECFLAIFCLKCIITVLWLLSWDKKMAKKQSHLNCSIWPYIPEGRGSRRSMIHPSTPARLRKLWWPFGLSHYHVWGQKGYKSCPKGHIHFCTLPALFIRVTFIFKNDHSNVHKSSTPANWAWARNSIYWVQKMDSVETTFWTQYILFRALMLNLQELS